MPRFYSLGLVAAIAVAWVGAMIHRSGHAPVGLVSLVVGAGLGAALCTIAAMLRIAGSQRLIICTIVLALVTVIAQHTWLYLDFRRQWHEARSNSPQVAMFRSESPWSPAEYLAHEATPRRVALWCVDAALVTSAAVGTMWIIQHNKKQPSAPSP
jgi:ABC-type uncharacterized transport system permease subunit